MASALQLPSFRLRTLFGATSVVVLTCAMASMLETAPPTQVGWRVCTLSVILGLVVGYRRAETMVGRSVVTALFGLGGCLMGTFLTLVACVWKDWTRANETADLVGVGAGSFLIVLFTPMAAIVALLMLRAWTWSAYDANPLPCAIGADANSRGLQT
jgi:hypothetical protein